MWKSAKEFCAKHVMATAITVTLVYVWILVFFHGAIFTSPGEIADNHKLNLLGDSVGGLTAPIALIWLIAAVVSQRQELNLTKSELAKTAKAMKKQVKLMRQQSRLQRAVARANIKQTWFQERFALYRYFKKVGAVLHDEVSYENVSELNDNVIKINFVFGKEVAKKSNDFFVMVSVLEMLVIHQENNYGAFPPHDDDGNLPHSMNEDENASVWAVESQVRKIQKELQDGQFIQAIEAVLELDETIEVSPNEFSDKSTLYQNK